MESHYLAAEILREIVTSVRNRHSIQGRACHTALGRGPSTPSQASAPGRRIEGHLAVPPLRPSPSAASWLVDHSGRRRGVALALAGRRRGAGGGPRWGALALHPRAFEEPVVRSCPLCGGCQWSPDGPHLGGDGGSPHLPAWLAAPPTRARAQPAPPLAPPHSLTEPHAAVPPCPPHPAAWPATDSRPAGRQTPHGGSLAAAARPASQPAPRGRCGSHIW